jgi:hypothetical protein
VRHCVTTVTPPSPWSDLRRRPRPPLRPVLDLWWKKKDRDVDVRFVGMHLGTGHPRPRLPLVATRRGAESAGDQRDGEDEADGDDEGAAEAEVVGSEADHGRSDHAPGVADREHP